MPCDRKKVDIEVLRHGQYRYEVRLVSSHTFPSLF
jgi:hypothetical protein